MVQFMHFNLLLIKNNEQIKIGTQHFYKNYYKYNMS